jgi:hypothetical protein
VRIKTIIVITLVIVTVITLPFGIILSAVGLELIGGWFIIIGGLSLLILAAIFSICHILTIVHQSNNPRDSRDGDHERCEDDC